MRKSVSTLTRLPIEYLCPVLLACLGLTTLLLTQITTLSNCKRTLRVLGAEDRRATSLVSSQAPCKGNASKPALTLHRITSTTSTRRIYAAPLKDNLAPRSPFCTPSYGYSMLTETQSGENPSNWALNGDSRNF